MTVERSSLYFLTGYLDARRTILRRKKSSQDDLVHFCYKVLV